MSPGVHRARAGPSTAGTRPGDAGQSGPLDRLRVTLSAIGAGLIGLAPHLLHHAGPLAGAALFAGVGGTLLFGALGFLVAIPLLVRLHRRHDDWRLPAAALALFAGMFLLSAFVVGPAITGSDPDDGSGQSNTRSRESAHEAHH